MRFGRRLRALSVMLRRILLGSVWILGVDNGFYRVSR
jgi:hypothetical protein